MIHEFMFEESCGMGILPYVKEAISIKIIFQHSLRMLRNYDYRREHKLEGEE